MDFNIVTYTWIKTLIKISHNKSILLPWMIQDLEEALLSDGSADGSFNTFLGDLHARLLRGLFETKDIQ